MFIILLLKIYKCKFAQVLCKVELLGVVSNSILPNIIKRSPGCRVWILVATDLMITHVVAWFTEWCTYKTTKMVYENSLGMWYGCRLTANYSMSGLQKCTNLSIWTIWKPMMVEMGFGVTACSHGSMKHIALYSCKIPRISHYCHHFVYLISYLMLPMITEDRHTLLHHSLLSLFPNHSVPLQHPLCPPLISVGMSIVLVTMLAGFSTVSSVVWTMQP